MNFGSARSLGWAGIALGVTLVLLALIPALPWCKSPPVAASVAPSTLTVPSMPATREIALPSITAPQRVSIPTINLNAGVVPVGLQPDGSLAAPEDFSLAGWYSGGPAPGPSVIVGHVDSHHGPAVFFRLHELVPGQTIMIETTNNVSYTFVVDRIEQHPKNRFPTTAVYGATTQRALRLITCGGEFERTTGSYRDNIVIFARLAE